jgi:glycosyltransferase involved in cell wall biosynthesis
VVDDGSTDDTAERLRAYGDRIRYVQSPHVGVSRVRNRGVREARRPLIAFLDSDDCWMPDKLQLQRTVMDERPDVVLCGTDFGHRARSGAETRRYLARWHGDPRAWSEILAPGVPFSSFGPLPEGRPDFLVHVGDLYFAEMNGDYVCTSTAVVRRSLAGDALFFPEDLGRLDDWACFSQVCRTGPVAHLDCETQWNCDHSGPRVTQMDEVELERERIVILERVWGRDPEFLARHGAQFREVLASHRLARARGLLVRGRSREAQEELRRAGTASLAEHALAALPGGVARALLTLRRRLRGSSVPGAMPAGTPVPR